MGAPRLSIVLPTHNGSRFLGEAIDSCLAQTWTDWELILVDDCSTDSTPEIIARYASADPRIRALRNATNLRLPKSLNVGFRAARGEYLTWTSDDNRYRPHALQAMAYVLDHDPDFDLVYSDYTAIDDDGRLIAHRHAWPIEKLCYANCVGASFLYRRRVHETLNGFDEEKSLIEDYDFWLRAARHFRFKRLAMDLYEYRHHERSLSIQHREAILTLHRSELRQVLGDAPWLTRDARARACVHLARQSLRMRRRRDALSDLILGCRLAPLSVLSDCLERAMQRALRSSTA